MLRGRRIGTTVLTTIVAQLATTACRSTTTDTGPVPASGPVSDAGSISGDDSVSGSGLLGPQLKVRFDLTGAITLKGEQTALATTNNGTLLKSCDDYVQSSVDGDQTYLVLPGIMDGPVDGQKVTLKNWIVGYTGAGDYPKDQLVAPGSRPSIAVDGKIYGTWPDSTSSKVGIDAKGGGRWTISKLATTGEGGRPGDAIEGTVMWTCRNP